MVTAAIALIQVFMCAITQRLVSAVFTAAKKHLGGFFSAVFDRRKFATLMRTVAKRLGLTAATSAPEIAFASGDVNRVGRALGYMGFGHERLQAGRLTFG